MIETRLALPVRSPTPFIVPWTWRAAGLDRASALATPHSASLWVWMPTRTLVAERGHDGAPSPRRSARAATSRWCRTPRRSRRPPRRRRGGSAARSRRRRGSRRRSARRRRRRACPAPRRNATESAIIARFSSRSTRTTFSRCSAQVLPTSVQTGREQSASTRSAGSSSARRRAGGSCRKRRSARARSSRAPAARRARAPWGSTPGSRPRSGRRPARRARARRAASPRRRATCPRPACRRAGWRRRAGLSTRPSVQAARPGVERRDLHDVEPLAVALRAAVERVRRRPAGRARVISPGLAGADRVVVDLAHRDELGRGAGQEDLVGQVELGARDVALDDLEAEVARDLHDRLAVDAVEDRRGLRGREDRRRARRRCSRPSPRRRSRASSSRIASS